MAQREWHPNFFTYMEMIIHHDNYKYLEIGKKSDGSYTWIATKQSNVGKKRVEWIAQKAVELGISTLTPYYSKVMYEIHPTKEKVCQVCGEKMWISYVYPNKQFIKKIEKKFGYTPNVFDTIYDINNFLMSEKNIPELELIDFYIKNLKLESSGTKKLDQLCLEIESLCRTGGNKSFGPGAMSNFPDRYDGFHTYNRCCRAKEDTGRHKDNMRSYAKDRRAYEFWSDGNIYAASKFMVSDVFKGQSADHIGPISLGFIHDSRFLIPLPSSDNSAKNNRISFSDIEKLISLERKHSISAVSWYAAVIWDWIKKEYTQGNRSELFLNNARSMLLDNFAYFMEVLWEIIQIERELGHSFLEKAYLSSKKDFFNYNYSFDDKGNILTMEEKRVTEANRKEYPRFLRVSFDSINDFHQKENRNRKVDLSIYQNQIQDLKTNISSGCSLKDNKILFEKLIVNIQNNIIKKA